MSWTKYFHPHAVGSTCTLTGKPLVQSDGDDTITIGGSVKTTLVDRRAVHSGMQYTVATVSTVTTTHSDPSADVEQPQVKRYTLKYVITGANTVEAPQQDVAQTGFTLRLKGFVVYPSPERLQRGARQTSTVVAEISFSDRELADEIRRDTTDHSATAKYRMTFEVKGIRGHTATVGGVTYRDAVGLTVRAIAVKAINAKVDAKSASAMNDSMRLFGGTHTVWFARGVGRIEEISHSAFGTDTSSWSGCTP